MENFIFCAVLLLCACRFKIYDTLDLDTKNTWTTLLDLDWFYIGVRLESTQTTLPDLNWFYDILDLDLKNTSTNLLDFDWFYYNQAGISLHRCC